MAPAANRFVQKTINNHLKTRMTIIFVITVRQTRYFLNLIKNKEK